MSTTIVEDVTKESYETKTFNSSEGLGSPCSKLWGAKPICRLCLSRRGPTHCLLSELTLLHKLRTCLPLKISETDKLPKEVCEMCSLKIIDIYEYYHKAKLAEKKLLLQLDNFSNSIDTPLETDKILRNEDSIGNFNECQLEINIKDEPLESAYEDLTTLYGDTRNENSKLSSKYTQTDDVVITFEKILDERNSPRNNEKIEIKEEFISESPWNSPSRDDILDSPDENDYSSEDNIALNKVLKIPPIKVRIKKEYSDIKKSKKSKKRKKELSVKKLKISSKESLIKKKRKGYLDNNINLNTEKSEESMKVEKSDHGFENGLEKKVDLKTDDKNWLNPVVSLDESSIWQCLTCFIFEKSRADLLQHYKDHVEYPERFVQNLDQDKKEKVEVDVKKDDDTEKSKKGKKLNYKLISPADNGGEPGYQCLQCRKVYKNKRSLNRHQICHIDARPFPCNICGRSYKRAYEILLHGRAHNGVKTLFCQYDQCNYSTVYPGALYTHQKRHAPDFKYTCEICNKGFDVLTWFEEHKNFHTGDKPFSCDLCGKSFIYSRYLASHRKTVHPETVLRKVVHKCSQCQIEFQYKKQLYRHVARVHRVDCSTSVLCHVCGKGLSSREHLKFHHRIHTGEKPHICRTCGKGFAKKCNLVLHERVHSGEKPHICSHCGKGFAQRSTLVIHERYHSGARPYVCLVCNKGFVAKGLLSMHQKTCILP